MTGNNGGAVELLRRRREFSETVAEVVAWRVPPSDRYPEGVKYSMQYTHKRERTIIRYDNFPDHPGASHHHKHVGDRTVVDIEFTGVFALYERFKSEVRNHGEPWD